MIDLARQHERQQAAKALPGRAREAVAAVLAVAGLSAEERRARINAVRGRMLRRLDRLARLARLSGPARKRVGQGISDAADAGIAGDAPEAALRRAFRSIRRGEFREGQSNDQ